MTQIGLREVQEALGEAFEDGLRNKYGPVLGTLYRQVIKYQPRVALDEDKLRKLMELDSAPVLKGIVTNKVDGATLSACRTLMIGGALQGDKDTVTRWATEGLNRCQDGTAEWQNTRAQWQAVLRDPGGFIQTARQIKYFLNQI